MVVHSSDRKPITISIL